MFINKFYKNKKKFSEEAGIIFIKIIKIYILILIKDLIVKEILSPLLSEAREGRPSAQFKACICLYHEDMGNMDEIFYILKAYILYFFDNSLCVCLPQAYLSY